MMPNDADGGTRWELAGAVRPARTPTGYTVVGGWEDPRGVGVRLIVHHPTDENLVRRLSVLLPIEVDADDGIVSFGEPVEVDE